MPSSRAESLPENDGVAPEDATSRAPQVPLCPLPVDAPQPSFRRGRTYPRATAWFGIRSFYGHLWHLAASAIATQDIDSRDWMAADDPAALTRKLALLIDPQATASASTVTEALGRDLI